MLCKSSNYWSPQNGPNPSLTVKLFCILAETYLGNNKEILKNLERNIVGIRINYFGVGDTTGKLKGGRFSEAKAQKWLEGINI